MYGSGDVDVDGEKKSLGKSVQKQDTASHDSVQFERGKVEKEDKPSSLFWTFHRTIMTNFPKTKIDIIHTHFPSHSALATP